MSKGIHLTARPVTKAKETIFVVEDDHTSSRSITVTERYDDLIVLVKGPIAISVQCVEGSPNEVEFRVPRAMLEKMAKELVPAQREKKSDAKAAAGRKTHSKKSKSKKKFAAGTNRTDDRW